MTEENIPDLQRQARVYAEASNISRAIETLERVLEINPNHAETLAMLGQAHAGISDFKNAIGFFERASKHMTENAWLWYDYGHALEHNAEYEHAAIAYLKAWRANPDNVRFPLFAGHAYHQAGNLQQALQIWSLGADQDPMLRIAHQNPNADMQTREKSKMADTQLRTFLSELHQKSLTRSQNPKRLQSSLWPQTHTDNVRYPIKALNPYVFYAPDLPAIPVFTNPEAPWVNTIESATDTIRTEYLTFMHTSQKSRTTDQLPYIDSNSVMDEAYDHLKGQDTWTAVHLYKDGKPQPCLKYFPQTLAALKAVPLVHFHNRPMEVFFSILKPGVHIPPHFGLANTRVTSHLPLIIPQDTCRIRVANHVHHWREGKLFLFDDSFNHEAWNDSQETRVVLIFEAWRPDIDPQEITTIQACFEDRDDWLKARKVPEITD